MSHDVHDLTDHVILFLDFLGFGEFAKTADAAKNKAILAALVEIASKRGAYTKETERTGALSWTTHIRPEVSTFSDHVVLSYPLDDGSHVAFGNHFSNLKTLMSAWVASMALVALDNGMLVRGGLTIGKLYHRDGVVFGPAMIEAHELESKVAVYPRVPVPFGISSMDKLGLAEDADGIWHLDYLIIFAHMQRMRRSNPDASPEDRSGQYAQIIQEKLQELRAQERWVEYAKWSWFKHNLALAEGRRKIMEQESGNRDRFEYVVGEYSGPTLSGIG